MRRTKIVATAGPATQQPQTMLSLLTAGVDLVRLNFSHGSHDAHRGYFRLARSAARTLRRPLAVLADLCGPKIRTGRLEGGGPVLLETGRAVVVTTRAGIGTAARIHTEFAGLPGAVKPGMRLLLADGAITLRVRKVSSTDIACVVEAGGVLGENKGIHVPRIHMPGPGATEKDLADLAFALDLGVDYVALSFVRTAADVEYLRAAMKRRGRVVPIIAKIEKAEALDNLDAILDAADGAMVARGDLGVELSLRDVPAAQKTVITQARRREKPVITATQMLESMIERPLPTRAEVSDIANAILDGSDAVMLSGETAVGAHPVQAAAMMASIAQATETSRFYPYALGNEVGDVFRSLRHAMATAAVHAADDAHAKAILIYTTQGRMAWLISRLRPRVPVVALTPSRDTYARMCLMWGVVPIKVRTLVAGERLIRLAEREALNLPFLTAGDLVVLVTGATPAPGLKSMLKFHYLQGV